MPLANVMKFRASRVIGPAAMAGAVATALYVLDRDLRLYRYRDLMRQVWVLPHSPP